MKGRLAAWLILALACIVAGAAGAEDAWVRGAPLNLRSGAGTEFRILASTQPGERLTVLKRSGDWTKVRTEAGKEGWIAAGYLDPEAPPTLRLTELEAEAERLQSELGVLSEETGELRSQNENLSSADSGQRGEIERLTRENYKLRAGTRSAEWLTGALILGMGMVLGAIVHSVTGRRRNSRLRL